jgi:hypothetical protein
MSGLTRRIWTPFVKSSWAWNDNGRAAFDCSRISGLDCRARCAPGHDGKSRGVPIADQRLRNEPALLSASPRAGPSRCAITVVRSVQWDAGSTLAPPL